MLVFFNIIFKRNALMLVFSVFFVFIFSNVAMAKDKADVTDFGASGKGEIDETDFIQSAINYQAAKGGGTVYLPKGLYLIDAVKSIVLKDNISLDFEKGAKLQALPNGAARYEVIEIHDVENVNIIGFPEIVGEKNQHLGTTGEWGFGISIRGSNDIFIENARVSDCWGDGIYIGTTVNQHYNKNIQIVDPILNNNRRQGISIISAINLYIYNARITNTNGTPPQSGIDIEPNFQHEKIQNVNLFNLSTTNNKGRGLLITLHNLKGSSEPVSINVDSVNKLEDGYRVINLEGVKGEVRLGGKYYLSEKPKESQRISGNDRYDTAIAISQEGWYKSDTVVLATSNNFPDALAGGPLAYYNNAPILLTSSNVLNRKTKEEIERLDTKKVIILGSEGAVSKGVEEELKRMGILTDRIGGKDRYETASLISSKLNYNKVIIANGLNFPDVLSVSPYASKNGIPILLTRSEQLPEVTKSSLININATYVIGNSGAINEEVMKSLPNPLRLGGADRYATGYAVANTLKLGSHRAYIATGVNFPDALTGSVLAAKENSPILLVRPKVIPQATSKQLAIYDSFSIIGGNGAVSEDVKFILDENLKSKINN